MKLTPGQADQLKRTYRELGDILEELGLLESPTAPIDPQWLKDTARQWGLINAAAQINDGDLSADEWSRLGRKHGYDPRGLGGFFQGAQPLMGGQGERRVLTTHGRRFIERWRADFGTDDRL